MELQPTKILDVVDSLNALGYVITNEDGSTPSEENIVEQLEGALLHKQEEKSQATKRAARTQWLEKHLCKATRAGDLKYVKDWDCSIEQLRETFNTGFGYAEEDVETLLKEITQKEEK